MTESFEPGQWDENVEAFLMKREGPWYVHVRSMIFNDRILLTHEDEYPRTCTSGYCYDKGAAAFLAAAKWNPDSETRPRGYKKIAFEAVRSLLYEGSEHHRITQSSYVGDVESVYYGSCLHCEYKTGKKFGYSITFTSVHDHLRDKHDIVLPSITA